MDNKHPSISRGIIQSISKLKEDHEFEDFKVKVAGDIYSCHSFILASCSEFFRRLLKTDIKEKQKMEVELKNISSPIFKLILNSLYTGCELLTKENVLEVWSAVHQLQITFLIEHCEYFAVTNASLKTPEDYKRQIEYGHSVKVSQYNIIDFICTHFEEYKYTEAMLRLNFQDFFEVVKSDKLQVKSEDQILYLIYDWVSYGDSLAYNDNAIEDMTTSETASTPQRSANETDASLQSSADDIDATSQSSAMNLLSTVSCLEIQVINSKNSIQCSDSTTKKELTESEVNKVDQNNRKKMLGHLLKATRYCLASHWCISHLFEDGLTQNDTEVKYILFQAISFRSSGYWLGYCPTSAIHRDCSKLRHVCVYCNSNGVNALCLKEDKWVSLGNLPIGKDSLPNQYNSQYHLTVFDGELYACTKINDYHFQIMKFIYQSWKFVHNVTTSGNCLFVANDKYIYCFSGNSIKRFNPNNGPSMRQAPHVREFHSPIYALTFYNNIVLFSSINYEENTVVSFYNTETLEYKNVDNIKFSSNNMTSFRDDRDTYILDSNGNLLKLINSRNIGFTFVAKLWSGKFEIKGALFFRETLFIFTASPNKMDVLDKVEGVFSSTRIRHVPEDASNLIHCHKNTKCYLN